MLLEQLPVSEVTSNVLAEADRLYAAHGNALYAWTLATPGSLRLDELAAWFDERGVDLSPRVGLVVQARLVAERMAGAVVSSFTPPGGRR